MSPTEKPILDKEGEDLIFRTAREQVLATVAGFNGGVGPDFGKRLGKLAAIPLLGTFVSFKKRGELRSCMGWMSEGIPLGEALQAAAVTAAKDDPRFPPIRASELEDLEMEVWVLWGMKEVVEMGEARIGTFTIGRHGLQIKSGRNRGLLLPGVATEFKMSPREFLEATCRKAGLPKDAWLDSQTSLYTFEGLAIHRPFLDEESRKRLDARQKEFRGGEKQAEYRWNFRPLSAPASSRQESRGEADRPAGVAGMFYPADAASQVKSLDVLFDGLDGAEKKKVAAVLVPHAGWIYSGRLAAEVFSRVEIPETVILFAPKHRAEGARWAVSPHRGWNFGGGRLAGDPSLAESLVRAVAPFQFDAVAHAREHSIEVELPLLARLAPEAKVVGALIGYGGYDEVKKAADAFGQFLTTLEKPPLLVISSDMNHFESEERTQKLDAEAMTALETLDPADLYQTVTDGGITMCGVLPACFVLEALRSVGRLHRAERVGHTTSAAATGDTDRVVGYAGYVFD